MTKPHGCSTFCPNVQVESIPFSRKSHTPNVCQGVLLNRVSWLPSSPWPGCLLPSFPRLPAAEDKAPWLHLQGKGRRWKTHCPSGWASCPHGKLVTSTRLFKTPFLRPLANPPGSKSHPPEIKVLVGAQMVLGSIPAHLQMGILICRWPSEHRPGAVSPCWSFCVPLQSHPRRCSVPWCCRNRFPCPLASSWVWPVGGVSTEAEAGR